MGPELQKLQSKHVKMMTEGQNDRMTDRLKTVYPPKLRLGGYNKSCQEIVAVFV